MNKTKSALIRRTDKFILITYYLKGLVSISDPEQELNYLLPMISAKELGVEALAKLEFSREISLPEFQAIFNSPKLKELGVKEEDKMQNTFGYRNRRELYKAMSFVTIDMDNEKIAISPQHQDGLDSFTSMKDVKDIIIDRGEFVDNLYEKIGKGIMQALNLCTSIYRSNL